MESEWERKLARLRETKAKAILGGGRKKIDEQHQKGKLTARERIDKLLDPGTFQEFNLLVRHAVGEPGDGIVSGHGTVDGREVCVFSQDATVSGGSEGLLHGYKKYRTAERALDMGVPCIGLNDSPGARGWKVDSPDGGGGIRLGNTGEKFSGALYYPETEASGVIPQLSAVLGNCAGNAVYGPMLTDFIFMVEGTSHMFITGPRVVKETIGEDVSMPELGGARIHAQVSGVADFRSRSEDQCFADMKRLLSFLPSNYKEQPPRKDTGDPPDRIVDGLEDLVPVDVTRPYDMRKLIRPIVDSGDFLEVKAEFAQEMIVGFARLDGHPVGIVANQPMVRGGALTVDGSDKQARFMRFCDCFNIPLILLVDTPAYLPGSQSERAGIIRHGAKVLYALCEATVPRIGIQIRKCYGGGTLGMGTMNGLKTDLVYLWPTAEMGFMGARASVETLHARQLRESADAEALKAEQARKYQEEYGDPLLALSVGCDYADMIEPKDTRSVLIKGLKLLRTKKVSRHRRKHGNIPL